MTKKTILVIDDEVINLNLLNEILTEYDVIDTTNPFDSFEILENEKIDLILLDIYMPLLDGFELCRRIKSNHKFSHIPIIFVTNNNDEDTIEKAYNCGGNDFIHKPFRKKEVLARVKTQIDIVGLIKYLEHLSFYDQLTGIYNRRKFFELANIKYNEKRDDLHAIMMDIDKFKSINDTHGHNIGDIVLKNMAHTVQNELKNNEIFARLGGEEFIILLNIDENKIEEFVENIRNKVASKKIILNEKETISYTISLGVSKYNNNFKNLDDFLHDADICMYKAKNSGRNRSIFRNKSNNSEV